MDLFGGEYISPDFVAAMEEPEFDDLPREYESEVVPDVRPAPQKGLGLSSLKESLSIFSEDSHMPDSFDATASPEDTDMYARTRQERLERDAITSALERWRKESEDLKAMGIDPALQTKSVGNDLWNWSEALQTKIREELNEIEVAENKANKNDKDKL